MKIHKEIFDQQSKMERAKNELKHAKKATKAKISNPEYLANFEVNKISSLVYVL